MASLEKHRRGVVEDVLTHHRRAGDLGLPELSDPARQRLACGIRQPVCQLTGARAKLAIVHHGDDRKRYPRPSATEPRDRLDQRIAENEAVFVRRCFL